VYEKVAKNISRKTKTKSLHGVCLINLPCSKHKGSGIPASQSSCFFFVQSGIAAMYPTGPSLYLNLFF
jgi:hypothetical protein